MSAWEIHRIHRGDDFGWAGIGYHYVVRKDGTIELGRPVETVGAHAQGANWNSVGIHVSGNFELADPTDVQVESLAYLVGWLCERYGLTPTAQTVVGHRDLMVTACPGRNLYDKLQTIRGKAIWYMQHYGTKSY